MSCKILFTCRNFINFAVFKLIHWRRIYVTANSRNLIIIAKRQRCANVPLNTQQCKQSAAFIDDVMIKKTCKKDSDLASALVALDKIVAIASA